MSVVSVCTVLCVLFLVDAGPEGAHYEAAFQQATVSANQSTCDAVPYS